MVCNPQCDRHWCWGVGGLLDGRAPQQATCHSQGMLLSVPHLNGREAPLCPPRPPGAAARSPAAPLRASAASRRPGCEWPGLARTPSWLSSLGCPPPPSPSLFPTLTRLWAVQQLGWGEWAGRSGHVVEEGRIPPQKVPSSSPRSMPGWPLSPHRLQAPASARLPPAEQRTPSSRSHPLFFTQKTFFIVETIPDPDDPVEGGLSPMPRMAGMWEHLRWHSVKEGETLGIT